ncbi:MAG: UvrD-helicase domain-containing protein [Clostridia bacterium]|nr:UvrD-helicase domain-containing protein [Clostridia bacterium]
MAKKGDIRIHHFAHNGEECSNPQAKNETALHEIAKRFIKEANSIMLPAFSLEGTYDKNCNKDDERQKRAFPFCDKEEFFYDACDLEKYIKEISVRPDVILHGDKEIYIEINVTHAVDEDKERKIKDSHIPCVEISLLEFVKGNFSEKELRDYLIREINGKKWIYHYNQEDFEKRLTERNRKLQEEWEEQRKREAERNRKRQEELEEQRRREAEKNRKLQEEWEEQRKREAERNRKRQEEWEEEFQRETEERKRRHQEQNGRKSEAEKNRKLKEEQEEKFQKATEESFDYKIDPILKKLNDEQIRPVLQTEGAVLVLAGAGSGKTRVLTTRIAYLIEEKRVPPSAILAITFTNKAANEMKERLSAIVDVSSSWVCTIHSMCVRILRMYAAEVGINSNFSIYSETERNNIIKKSFQECDFDDEKLLKSVKFHIANAKMLGFDPERYAEEYAGERDIDEITKVYNRYQKHLRENNALDFDDLLNETRLLLRKNEEVREYLGSKFRYILVDEFQDTNAVQYEIIKLLASVHKNLFAVGDDDQSIYGWRGAKIENILHFEKDFKDAKVFKLERNYRSTKHILQLANTVIKNNGRRKDKTLWTENEDGEHAKVYESEEESGEARYIAQTIRGLVDRGYSYSDFAILMRLNALTRSFEQEFTADAIPYKVFGGFKFFERKEIKDLLAYLRLINNPFDSEAVTRIINFPKRGIGAKTVETLQNYAFQNEISLYAALRDLDELGFSGATAQKLLDFRNLVKTWIIQSQEIPVNELVKNIIADTKMREAYADDSDESINKRANIDEFVNSVEEYCRLNQGATLTDYLQQVTLSSDTDEMDDSNYVTLATVHSVKGLEFTGVFICGLEENILPVSRAVENDDDMEEERRLMYVAITRAKKRLWLTRSKSRYLYGKREPTARSRFLKELSSEVELPKEIRRMPMGYSDYDDPESYGNDAYVGGRYKANDNYGGRRTNFGGYQRDYSRENSSVSRSTWNGGSSYGNTYGNTYGSSYGARTSTPKKDGGFVYGGVGKPAPKPVGATKDLTVFKTGVKVAHPKFGLGTIVGVRGVGANTILDIAFENLGIKQLSANLAPLTVKNG